MVQNAERCRKAKICTNLSTLRVDMLDDAQLFSPRDTARPTTGWPAGLATPRQPAVCMAQQGLAPTLVTGDCDWWC